MNKNMSTKDKLLNVLKRHPKLTMKEIMDYFSISEIAVRRHLHELVQEGFIERVSNKQEIGRPYYTYSLTEKGHGTFPTQGDTMSLELLEDIESLYGEQAVIDVLTKWKNREKKALQEAVTTDDFDKKIKQIAEVRYDHGYMVDIDQTKDGHYKMKYYNCPIASIACKYHELCVIETEIYADLFENSEISPQSMITEGDHCCTWKIKRPVGS